VNEAAARVLFERDVHGLSERLLTSRNWNLYSSEFPVLDVGFRGESRAELRLRLVATNWNDEPPSVALLNSAGEFLSQLPRHAGNVFNNGAHPATGRPFVCMAGAREYHTHSSHLGDVWENYRKRDGYTLGGILTQLWHAWLKSAP